MPLAERLRYWRRQGVDLPDVKIPLAGASQPFWLQLPAWLARRGRNAHGARIGARVLRDIRSGQYTLFLVARLQDDVVDGADTTRITVYAADDLLMEAERQFARHLGDDAWFWRHFRACLSESVRAAAETGARQRRPGAMNKATLHLYGRMSRMLVIGAAAVCAIGNRRREFADVVALAHELAIAGQLVDDLFDIDEDLADQRFNFAANWVGVGDRRGSPTADGRLGRAVLIDDAVGRMLAEVERHLHRAAQIANSMKLREATDHVNTVRDGCRLISAALQRTRFEHLCAELLPRRLVARACRGRRKARTVERASPIRSAGARAVRNPPPAAAAPEGEQ